MSLTSNANALAGAWEKRAQAVAPTMRQATRDATDTYLFESKKQMKRLIYDKPVPLGPNGKKLWHRTGNLLKKEKRTLRGDYIGIIYNNAESKKKSGKDKGTPYKYARKRHYMRSRYPAPWRTETTKIVAPKIRNIYRMAIRKALAGGLIPGKV